MKALGYHVFAGAMSLGVRAAGFSVRAQVEPHDFGVETARSFGFPVTTDRSAAAALAKNADMLFGNPRCSAFSIMTANYGESISGPKADACADWLDVVDLAERARPATMAVESVQQIMTTGRPFLAEVVGRLVAAGYSTVCAKYCCSSFGMAQKRRRFMLLASRVGGMTVDVPRPARAATVADVFGALGPPKPGKPGNITTKGSRGGPDTYQKHSEDDGVLIAMLRPGEGVLNLAGRVPRKLWPKTKTAMLSNMRDRIARGSVGFGAGKWFKLRSDAQSYVVTGTGHRLVHPELPRPLTLEEIAALMQWPAGAIPTGAFQTPQIGKGVSPAIGRWVGECAKTALGCAAEWSFGDGAKVERLTDVGLVADFNDLAPPKPRTIGELP